MINAFFFQNDSIIGGGGDKDKQLIKKKILFKFFPKITIKKGENVMQLIFKSTIPLHCLIK